MPSRAAVVLALLPLALPNNYFYDIAIAVALNAIVCVGLNLLIGYAGQISLGHAGYCTGRGGMGGARSLRCGGRPRRLPYPVNSFEPGRSVPMTRWSSGGSGVFEPNQRVKVNLSGLTIRGVAFSQNVQEALGTIVQRVSAEPPTYLVDLLFSFKGVKRVEVPEERIRQA